jgi:hypothetical protein
MILEIRFGSVYMYSIYIPLLETNSGPEAGFDSVKVPNRGTEEQ